MSRAAADAVALAADAAYSGPGAHLPLIAARSKAFDPRAPLPTMGLRCFMRSNAVYDKIDYCDGGSFAEVGASRHAVKA